MHSCNVQGIYKRRAGAMPTLTLLGPVLDELRAQPGSAVKVDAAHALHTPADALQNGPTSDTAGAAAPSVVGNGATHADSGQLAAPQHPPDAGTAYAAAAGGAGNCAPDSVPAIGPLGPPQPLDVAADAHGLATEEAQGLAAAQETAEALEEGPAGELMGSDRLETAEGHEGALEQDPPRRVVGPAMPSAELLAAAAEAKEAVRCAELHPTPQMLNPDPRVPSSSRRALAAMTPAVTYTYLFPL